MAKLDEALAARHDQYNRCSPEWRYYADHYEGGPSYPSKTNPLPFATFDSKLPPGHSGTSLYLWQHPIERKRNFSLRLARAVTMNPCQPVVDLYAQTVGRQDLVTLRATKLTDFLDDCDRQGQSLLQFLNTARINAAVRGHTFLFVDSPTASQPIVTEADARAAGLRPYVFEIRPENLFNWRFDDFGRISEVLFRLDCEPSGSLLEAPGGKVEELRYWSPAEWRAFRKTDGAWMETRQGRNPLGRVPMVPLYHKRKEPYLGESLMKDAAKIQQLLTNWVSGFDEALLNQMFAQLVIKTRKELEEIGVGTSVVIRLNPEDGEELSYVSPDAAPFEAGWSAYRQMENRLLARMGMKAGAVKEDGNDAPAGESGVAKAYDFFEAYKIMGQMALQEQEAVKQVLELAEKWRGASGEVEVAYSTKYDLSTPSEDVQNLVALQAAGAPAALRRELLRNLTSKMLPSLSDQARREIDQELELYGEADLNAPLPASQQSNA